MTERIEGQAGAPSSGAAPERIFTHPCEAEWHLDPYPQEPAEYTEYIRADLAVTSPGGTQPCRNTWWHNKTVCEGEICPDCGVIFPFAPPSPSLGCVEAFKNISEKFGHMFDKENPDAFAKRIRYGEDRSPSQEEVVGALEWIENLPDEDGNKTRLYGLILASEVRRLRALVEAQEWLPIDTAPRDGTAILIHSPSFCECGHFGNGEWRVTWDDTVFGWPQFWRPLPPNPGATA